MSIASQGRTDRLAGHDPWTRLALFLFARKSEPSPLALARKARWEAAEEYADAKRNGDTRAQHHAHAAFRRATAEVVRLELQR